MKIWEVSKTDQSECPCSWLFTTYDLAKKFFEDNYKRLKAEGLFSGTPKYDSKWEKHFYVARGEYYESWFIEEQEVIENEEDLKNIYV